MQAPFTTHRRDTPYFDPFLMGISDPRALNTLMRGELAAVEAYDKALPRFHDRPEFAALREIRNHHHESVERLGDRVIAAGGEPVESSGSWGVFATGVTAVAKLLGTQALLAALCRGEEHGISSYQTALNEATLSAECVALIDGELVPRCRQHVAQLEELRRSWR